mgnify:CR=1 FL=1
MTRWFGELFAKGHITKSAMQALVYGNLGVLECSRLNAHLDCRKCYDAYQEVLLRAGRIVKEAR